MRRHREPRHGAGRVAYRGIDAGDEFGRMREMAIDPRAAVGRERDTMRVESARPQPPFAGCRRITRHRVTRAKHYPPIAGTVDLERTRVRPLDRNVHAVERAS